MSCRCHGHHARPRVSLDVTRPGWRTATVTIVCGGRSATVRPATLVARHELEGLGVRLVDIWSASHLTGDMTDLSFDLLGEGGYRATRNGLPALSGGLLSRGYLVLETGRVEWDSDAGLACGYRVKGLTMLIAQDAREQH